MAHAWRSEIFLGLSWLLIALVVGLLSGHFALSLTGFVLLYFGRHTYFTHKTLSWLRSKTEELPDGNGVWEEIFQRLRTRGRRHRRRKRRLVKILKRFRQATDALPDATVVLTKDFEIDWFNQVARRYLKLRPSDRGIRIDNILRQPAFVAYLKEKDFEHPITLSSDRDDRTLLEIRIVPFTGNQYLLLAQDVTKIRLLENQRRDFVANVSHELKTPITVLRGYLETLMDAKGSVDPNYQPLLARMEEQIRRLQYLIDDLLYLSRLETARRQQHTETVTIEPLVREICEEIDQIQKRHAPIKINLDSAIQILGNKEELRSAITNLINNALKHTTEADAIFISWFQNIQGGFLEIKDTGEGIPEKHLPRLTERFYRVTESETANPTGTGLGLAIVKHVLNRHDAHLEIESQLGKGSTFRCCFPRQRIVDHSNHSNLAAHS